MPTTIWVLLVLMSAEPDTRWQPVGPFLKLGHCLQHGKASYGSRVRVCREFVVPDAVRRQVASGYRWN